MTNFLAIDTSSRYLTVVAQKGERSVTRHLPESAMQHSVVLMGEIEKALAAVNLTPEKCDFFAAVTGPGSFTGIRIGLATAKGFALATGKRLKGVTAFDLIAYNVSVPEFYAVIDAGRSHYYVCGYSRGKITLEPCYRSEEQLSALGGSLFGFENLNLKNYTALDIKDCLRPVALNAQASDEVHALYVRKSQAEENLREIKGVEI